MRKMISFLFLSLVHFVSRVFFSFESRWIGKQYENPWGPGVKMIAFLHHTSLFEPLILGKLPLKFFYWGCSRVIIPGADKTLQRPLVGGIYKLLFPKIVSITRQRDHTWDYFLKSASSDSLIVIAPEGRMMRKNGLDSKGKPMSVRAGIADILWHIDSGDIIFIYSGGMHHIQAPGDKFPRLFQKIKVNLRGE